MKYLKSFKNEAAYNNYITASTAFLPNVSLVGETDMRFTPYTPAPTPHYYENDYLTFQIETSGNIVWKKSNDFEKTISYSKNSGKTWVDLTSTSEGAVLSVSAGDTVLFKGSNATYYDNNKSGNCFSASTAQFSLEGNVMSLVYGDSFTGQTSFSATHVFYNLFNGCTGLTSAVNLVLPATTLTEKCYVGMFKGCANLSVAPVLPAMSLGYECYHGMFEGCTSLGLAPSLPATSLTYGCYHSMFKGCTSLNTVPALQATSINQSCYASMFEGCTSIETAQATLSAMSLENNCYSGMFKGCISLKSAPTLPATSLASTCYGNMFENCTSLTNAPALPATTLSNYCYSSMFQGCTKLSVAPVLSASTLVQGCYSSMFRFCDKVGHIICLATDISAQYCTAGWVQYVSESGIFEKASSMSSWTTGTEGIPSGWTVQDAS